MRKKTPLTVGFAMAATITGILLVPMSALSQSVPAGTRPPLPSTPVMPGATTTLPSTSSSTTSGAASTADQLNTGNAATIRPNLPVTPIPSTPSPLPTLRPQLLPSPGAMPIPPVSSQMRERPAQLENRRSQVGTIRTEAASPGGNGARGPFPLNAGSTMGVEVRRELSPPRQDSTTRE